MNLDSNFFYCLLRDGDPRKLMDVPRSWIDPDWQKVYDFCQDCLDNPEMKRLPQADTVGLRYSIDFFETSETIDYYINELRKRRARLALEDGLREAFQLIEEPDKQNKPVEAADQLMQQCAEIKRVYRPVTGGEAVDYTTDIELRKQEYEKREARRGIIGIPYPFEPMNLATGGLVDGEVSVILARSGVGKTWFLCLVASHALRLGKNVLVVTQEMPPKGLAMRFDGLLAGVPPDRHRLGMLNVEERDRLWSYYDGLSQSTAKLHIYGKHDIRTLGAFEALLSVMASEIDLVCWDSPYLLTRSEKDWETRAGFVEMIKYLAEDYNKPFFLTWQLNSQGQPAFTAAIKTDVDHNFLADVEGLEDLFQIKVSSIKTREGMSLREMRLEWNIARARFDVLYWKIPGLGDSGDYTVDVFGEEGRQ